MRVIHVILLLLVSPILLLAQTSLRLAGKPAGVELGFNSAPKGVRALRLEFRIHDFQLRTTQQQEVVNGACSQFLAILPNSPLLQLVDFASGGQSHVIDLEGLSDVIVRVQHFIDEGVVLFEAWDSSGKTYRSQRLLEGRKSAVDCQASFFVGAPENRSASFTGSMAYFRWFPDTVAPGSAPGKTSAGALLAYEFEGSGSESTGNGKSANIPGTPDFVPTPAYPPVVILPKENTVGTTDPLTLDGSSTFSSADIVAWRWEQISGPVPAVFSNSTSAKTDVLSLTAAGTYEFRLSATDSQGRTGSGIARVGVVPTNSLGIVQVSDPGMSFLLGPMLRSGLSPWPYYDQLRLSKGAEWAALYADLPGEKDVRAGRITVTRGSARIVGIGTSFISDFVDTPRAGNGSVDVMQGSRAVRGNGTQFISAFLRDRHAGRGQLTLQSGSDIVKGQGTSFTSDAREGGYLLVSGSLAETSSDQALQIVQILDDTSVRVSTAWGGATRSGVYEVARDAGMMLVIEPQDGPPLYFAPVVQSDTELILPTAYTKGTVTGSPFKLAGISPYNTLVAHYPVNGSTEKGRRELPVVKVLSDTELIALSPVDDTGWTSSEFGRAKIDDLFFWQGDLNYYDSALVQYQNYYRTGLEQYRTWARQLADNWFTMLDSGRLPYDSPLPPRMISLGGLIARALDGRPEMWPMITRYVDDAYPTWVGLRIDYPGLYYGVRDGGFVLYHAALLAALHPDLGVREKYLALTRSAALDLYARLQRPDGSWRWNDDLWTGEGEQPFHVGLLLEGMVLAHQVTQDPMILNAITRSLDHLTSIQQPSPCRSPVYAIYVEGGPWGLVCPDDRAKPDVDSIRDSRAGNNTLIHAYGYAFAMTGDLRFKIQGDDIFAATFGNGQGPGADSYQGRADSSTKQYGQSFRSSGAYLAYRTQSPNSRLLGPRRR